MSLINKYRPQYFRDVKGQDKIVTPLVKSLKSGKLHNAYLFSGRYGTGKTTLARLLAKGMNCLDFKDDLCGKCIACNEGKSQFDIIEIDAASNRGIDEIRRLQIDSQLTPFSLKYKVYIIDEAHQLTSQASNAFLKTLEEPNSSTKFIFCTTEPNKLLATIKSRCLPFNVGTIRFYDIKDRLEYILEKEGYTIKDERLLFKIAEKSNNTLRDAVNYLELCFNNAKDKVINWEVIENTLSIVSDDKGYELLEYLVSGNTVKFFNSFNDVLKTGKKHEDIISFLKNQVKEIIFVKKGITKGISKYKLEIIKDKPYPISQLFKMLQILTKMSSKVLGYVDIKDTTELGFLQILLTK